MSLELFRCNSSFHSLNLPFVSTLLLGSAVPSVSTFCSFFFQALWDGAIRTGSCSPSGYLRLLSYLRRLPTATCCHLTCSSCGHLLRQPPAATCGHSGGCKWLQVAAFMKFNSARFATSMKTFENYDRITDIECCFKLDSPKLPVRTSWDVKTCNIV